MSYNICITFTGVLSTVGYILIAVLCLMFMVVIHELGHYLAGKLLKFKILEFAIGFGPPIFKRTNKKNGEIFTIRPFPLGGSCMFEAEDDNSASPSAFNNQAPWKRLIVLFAGAFFNFLSALIIITLIFTFYGQLLPVVNGVYQEADIYGVLQEGDVIVKVNNKQVNILMMDDLQRAISDIEEEGTFTVLRDKKLVKLAVKRSQVFERDADGNVVYDESNSPKTRYAFGFTSMLAPVKLNFFHGFARSFSYGFYVVWKILWLFGQLFTGGIKFSESAGGPITIISTMSNASKAGFGPLAYVVSLLSANIAIMNLLPFPALDGSRMVFTAIEWIRKKPINKKIEGAIHFGGLIVLFAFAIFADALRFIP
ncbi:MAG: M50 family metallopeptidase [Clostridia bacterium]|nr:M50 family metallopeptidase [Clostridia bacterium]